MKNSKKDVLIFITLISFSFITLGCETEQSASKNNNGMVGYAQDHAKVQAELINKEQLSNTTLSGSKVITDGSTQTLSSQK